MASCINLHIYIKKKARLLSRYMRQFKAKVRVVLKRAVVLNKYGTKSNENFDGKVNVVIKYIYVQILSYEELKRRIQNSINAYYVSC